MSTFYTQAQINFIAKARKTMTAKQIAEQFNIRFGTNKNAKAINGLCVRHGFNAPTDGRFKPDYKPWNAGSKGHSLTGANHGSFKKNNRPYNQRPIGSERIDQKNGYIYVKIAEPRTWKAKHLLIWEQHHGPIPPGKIIRFIDDDVTNISINNLEMISKQENMKLNQYHKKNADPQLKPIIRMIAKIECKCFEHTVSQNHG